MSNEKWKTVQELMEELNSNPDYLQKMTEKAKRQNARDEQFKLLEQPIIEIFNAEGFEANSIEDIIEKYSPLPQKAVDILLDNIKESSDIILLEWLVRALAAARRPFDGRILVECYNKNTDPNLRWVIVNTIACAKPHSIDDWIETALRDPWLGKTLRELGFSS